MDTLKSSEFRKRFAGLRQPTQVTVNGHLIGVWTPQVTTDGQSIADLLKETDDPRRLPATLVEFTNAHDDDDTIRQAWSRSKPAPKKR